MAMLGFHFVLEKRPDPFEFQLPGSPTRGTRLRGSRGSSLDSHSRPAGAAAVSAQDDLRLWCALSTAVTPNWSCARQLHHWNGVCHWWRARTEMEQHEAAPSGALWTMDVRHSWSTTAGRNRNPWHSWRCHWECWLVPLRFSPTELVTLERVPEGAKGHTLRLWLVCS